MKIILAAFLFMILLLVASCSKSDPANDQFAKCLTEKGAKFYGAFWCPHCVEQKKMFGSSIEYINYIECSTADRRGQVQACQDAQIEGYPTWEFGDGSRLDGTLSFETLADKTGCQLNTG